MIGEHPMIEETSGDLLSAEVEALVNAVNTVGVMGKGLALAFKKRFPDNFGAYQRACGAGEVVPGKMFVFDRALRSPRWIINFPTKRHWREPSRLDDLRTGLVDLIAQVHRLEIGSLAMPALGCGLGGLEWTCVRALIVEAFATIPTTRVLLYTPK
jgi:O-acetyl-ADP-ribose deacetylase (regulator of RNase III)